MTHRNAPPHAGLKKVFHEPSRMAIVTALCASDEGCSFGDLKQLCALTDGNLNRHLKALSDAEAIRVQKTVRRGRTCTIVRVTDTGRIHFLDYLRTLENVLRTTAETLSAEESVAKAPRLWQGSPRTT